jgi:light-regulated signal transduction histidine kinase (bacteriophytochrome)
MGAKTPRVSTHAAEAPPASAAVRTADPSPRQEKLLSEISHELGNYFHKLYYWAELLREQRPPAADAEPAMLLERTIRDLETFLKSALEYFRPISVVPSPMPVDELSASVRSLVTRYAEPAAVRWQMERSGGAVAVDPGRFSFVLQGLVRRLDTTGGGEVAATAGVQGTGSNARYVLTLVLPDAERATVNVAATIEWAVIERVVELHGGMAQADTTGAERTVRLTLPVRF